MRTMKSSHSHPLTAIATLGVALLVCSGTTWAAVDEDAAKSLAKKNDCMKCHAIDKDKKATSYKAIAANWKGKADAEAKLIDSLTKTPRVKLKDGTEEDHKAIGTKNMAEIKNLIAWILSQ
jgi:cytochrome c